MRGDFSFLGLGPGAHLELGAAAQAQHGADRGRHIQEQGGQHGQRGVSRLSGFGPGAHLELGAAAQAEHGADRGRHKEQQGGQGGNVFIS